jgi:hypothetical protein
MEMWALAIAALVAVAIVRMFPTGSASVDGEALRRDEEPEIYWSVFVAALLIEGLLFGRGFRVW